MPNSRRYNYLVKRIKELENNLLPPVNPIGQYSTKDLDNIRGFKLLAHAEIEAYFEDIAEEKVKKSFKAWDNKKTKSKVLMSLGFFLDKKFTKNDVYLVDRIYKILRIYFANLRKNHGIREDNILSILLPIGVEYHEIDPILLNDLNSFGKERGTVAHKSSQTYTVLDPAIEKSRVQNLILQISSVDQIVRQLS